MDKNKVEEIKRRFDKIYSGYENSDKTEVAKYWEEMDKLTEAYFREKFVDK